MLVYFSSKREHFVIICFLLRCASRVATGLQTVMDRLCLPRAPSKTISLAVSVRSETDQECADGFAGRPRVDNSAFINWTVCHCSPGCGSDESSVIPVCININRITDRIRGVRIVHKKKCLYTQHCLGKLSTYMRRCPTHLKLWPTACRYGIFKWF